MQRRILFYILICCVNLTVSIWGIDVKNAIKAVADKPLDKQMRRAEAQKLLASGTANEVVTTLLQIIKDDQEGIDQQAARRLMMALEPFPFEELSKAAIKADDASIRSHALGFMNLGAKSPSEFDRVITEAKKSITDERVGTSYFGDARAHAPEGFRVCDVAYNILVRRFNLRESYPLMDGSNFVVPDRNQHIDKLCSQLGLPLHTWSQAYPPAGNPVTLALPKEASTPTLALPKEASTQQFPESPIISHIATPETVHEKTSQDWLTWLLVVITATVGAAWIYMRKTK